MMTARAAIASALEKRARQMFEEDGPLGLASWDSLSFGNPIRTQYLRLAEVELEREVAR